MPFLKFSRDKRGYEHFSIVEPSLGRRGKSSRPRVLFWFRTPPQVKVGREPFTDEVRRAIEAQNPGLKFDWVRLMATPIPAADAEHWRERRRAEKAARLAMRGSGEGEHEEPEGQDGRDGHAEPGGQAELAEPVEPVEPVEPMEQLAQSERPGDDSGDENGDEHGDQNGEDNVVDETEPPAETTPQASEEAEQVFAPAAGSGGEPVAGGRRRRRRGRRRRHQTVESSSGAVAPTSPEPIVSNVPVPPTEEV